MNSVLQLNEILRKCVHQNVSLSKPYQYPIQQVINRSYPLKDHIIMYTHNGFGNQLYQLAFGHLVSSSLNRRLHVADEMPTFMYNPHHPDRLDPNSFQAYEAGRQILRVSRVNESWVTSVCQGSNLTYSERRADKKSPHSRNFMLVDNPGWVHILKSNPKCIMLLGYWLNPQWFLPFLPEVKGTFRRAISQLESYIDDLDPSDVVIHIRCAESHYLMMPEMYYHVILQDMKINYAPKNIYLVLPGFQCVSILFLL